MIDIFPLAELPTDISSFWDKAILANPALTPFHSYGWLYSWCSAYGALNDAIAIVESDQGLVHGILPMLSLPNELRTLPTNATDYTGLVWIHDNEQSVQGIATYLRNQAASMAVTLWNVRQTDPLIGYLGRTGSLTCTGETPIRIADVQHASYTPEHSPNSISTLELDHKAAKLTQRGAQISFSHHTTHRELVRSIELHTERWKLKGEPGKFADDCRIDFVRRVIEESPVKFFFATMYVDGALIAYRFGPRDSAVYYDWNTGFDPQFKKLSPGTVLLKAIFDHLKRDTEIRYLDFLRGDEYYKRAWAQIAKNVYEFIIKGI